MKFRTGSRDRYLRIMAVLLMLAGVLMLFTELSVGLAFAFITVGAALTAVSLDQHRRDRMS
jgi:hypothetical protein